MKIIFTIPKLTYSGAPKMMAWIANQMAEKGHEVHLIAFYSDERARMLHESVVMHTLNVIQSEHRWVRNTVGMVKSILRLRRYIKRLHPDVVVSFQNTVSYAYLPIGRIFDKVKVVLSERSDPYAYRGFNANLRFFLMKFAHGTVFQTTGAREFFVRRRGIYDNSIVIPNPVVIDETAASLRKDIPKWEERDNRIVTAGRLSLRQKRQDVLLEAFGMIHAEYPEYKLVIYGDGPDEDRIRAMIDASGLADSVILAGRTAQVESAIFKARAFALTSDYEGIPNALIEAMSIGVPCVSTDCSPGGAALLIKNGENGFLVPRGDAGAAAEKLMQLIADMGVSERFSANSLAIAEQFTETEIAGKWEDYFMKIAGDVK